MNQQPPSAYCIIVAAGSGRRFGTALPKQFCELEGWPVIMHTIKNIRNTLNNVQILLVISKDYHDLWQNLCAAHDFESPEIVYGGDTRWQSVKNAIMTIPASFAGPVLIHDGARPLVDPKVVISLLKSLDSGADGVVPCIPVVDSLRMSSDSDMTIAVDRSLFHAVQTPQAFPYYIIKEAYSRPYSPMMTDDASVCEMNGFTDIRIVDGSPATIKITRQADLATAAFYLNHS